MVAPESNDPNAKLNDQNESYPPGQNSEVMVGNYQSGETQETYISTVSVHTPNWEFDIDPECPGTSLRSLKINVGSDVEFEMQVENSEMVKSPHPELDCDIEPNLPEANAPIPTQESQFVGDDGTQGVRTNARTEFEAGLTVQAEVKI